ncbi:MAG: NADH-quinone oxidoreductase subunit C [Candidatus Levybacteria bacterium]|nr:NADH-quinone oxidoreductase subunit C [Candidatus Levybacteria bacterium]
MKASEIIKQYIPEVKNAKTEGNLLLFEVTASELAAKYSELYVTNKLPLKTIKATDERKKDGCFRIYYIFGVPSENIFIAPYLSLKDTASFPSIVPTIHEATRYELEIKSFFGLDPAGHPQSGEQFILQENWPLDAFPLRKDFLWDKRPPTAHNPYHFQEVEGEGIYEIPVGPVHAGIIEPGHFRFSVAGEEIVSLEPQLGYTHKGSEKLFEILPLEDKIRLSERISGDSSFAHSLAFCMAMESLSDIKTSARADYLRLIFAELERIANHFGDIGFIMNDTGFAFGGSNGTRLREYIMQWNEKLTGSRFLRGVNTIGTVTKDISSSDKKELTDSLGKIEKDFSEVISIAEDNESLINRLKGTGTLNLQAGLDHGITGIAAKALGIQSDARINHPYGAYKDLPLHISTEQSGDVYSRYRVRVKEVNSSIALLKKALEKLPESNLENGKNIKLRKNSYAVSVAEGWRGDIVYFVKTDEKGNIERVGIRDCSFLNWAALPHAVLGNIIPDFPLINKSFNLSYSGNDR